MDNQDKKVMFLEKLQKYNQILYALLGTLAMIGLIVFVLFALGTLFFTTISSPLDLDVVPAPDAVETDELEKRNLHFEAPVLLDKKSTVYFIPLVIQNSEEARKSSSYSRGSSSSSSGYWYNSEYYGTAANLIHYDPVMGINQPLFNFHISINSWEIIKTERKKLLFLYCTEKDSNQDKVLNSGDRQVFYLYNIDDQSFRKVERKGETIIQAWLELGTDQIILRSGLDQDKNGRYSAHNEPARLYRYNPQNGKIQPMISPETQTGLKKILEKGLVN